MIVDPACEVNERGTRDKNDRNDVVDNCDLPLDLESTERVEVDDKTHPYVEEDWDCPGQNEVDKGVQSDFLFTMERRQSKRGKNKWSSNRRLSRCMTKNRLICEYSIGSMISQQTRKRPS